MASVAEREHMSRVAALGCIACAQNGHKDTPAELHHVRTGQGLMRAKHDETIPLCPHHHRHGGYGEAFHAGKKAWEAKYGTELDLLAQVREMLNERGDAR